MERGRTEGEACGCKVGRMISAYELTESNRRLVERWTADDESLSLRDLASDFNRELLRAEVNRYERITLDGEITNLYRLLTDEDVSAGAYTQTRRRLEQQGLDVDTLTNDFVSYQSIYRHLDECLGVEYTKDELSIDDRRSNGKERIFALRNRTETVVQETLTRLVGNDALDLEEFDTFVALSVTCRRCHRQYTVDELIENEGCECQQT